jgi:hypothetical protein
MDNKVDNIREKRLVRLLEKLSLGNNWYEIQEKIENFLKERQEIEMEYMFQEFYNSLTVEEQEDFDKGIDCSNI